ncbi:hypothetical protein J2T55_000802 [Methylohalomonas lacus]|uniref:Uncharacterized protein n=1 Tax=Methylohalomonas lacus TaxID=398773 RepID=A0AAE3L3U9_9GAMM|nr:hypothetical protein [Methylohalomonas lacus]MCS3902798.1 hypothetical protein [Methylohalomonas lacus]
MGITSNGNQTDTIKLSNEELDARAEEYRKSQDEQGFFVTFHEARAIVIREHANSLRSQSAADYKTERRKIHADARQQAKAIYQQALEYKGQQANLGINISMVDAVNHVRKQIDQD